MIRQSPDGREHARKHWASDPAIGKVSLPKGGRTPDIRRAECASGALRPRERENPHALARRCIDRVGNRRANRRHTRLTHARRSFGARHDVDLDLRHQAPWTALEHFLGHGNGGDRAGRARVERQVRDLPDPGADPAVIVLARTIATPSTAWEAAEPRAGELSRSVKAAMPDRQPRSGQWRYGRTLYTTSCSRACWTTFRPKSVFGPTSVTGA